MPSNLDHNYLNEVNAFKGIKLSQLNLLVLNRYNDNQQIDFDLQIFVKCQFKDSEI